MPNDDNTKRPSASRLALGLVSLGVLLTGAYFALRALVTAFSDLDKSVEAALITGFATITVATISIVGARYFEQKRAIAREIHEKQIPMYEEFVRFMFRVFGLGGEAPSEDEIVDFLRSFTTSLIVWGSNRLIVEWSAFRRAAILQANANGNPSDPANIFLFEKLLVAIRQEFGHPVKGLSRGDLLGLFVNDIDQYL
jgi:hypothetical protein